MVPDNIPANIGSISFSLQIYPVTGKLKHLYFTLFPTVIKYGTIFLHES